MRSKPKKSILPLVLVFALVFVLIADAGGITSYADEVYDTGQGMNEAIPDDGSEQGDQMTTEQGMVEKPGSEPDSGNGGDAGPITAEDGNELLINSAEELYTLSEMLNNGLFTQTYDIDISNAKVTLKDDIVLGGDFKPIGNFANPFKGEFDGGGFTISNLTIYNENEGMQGLFGVVSVGGSIHDVNLTNVRVNAYTLAGGIAGVVEFGEIRGCTVRGDISAFDSTAGGIAGMIIESTVEGCVTSGSVSAYWSDAGGIVGKALGYDAIIRDCSSSSQITVKMNAGGIAGSLAGAVLYNCKFGGKTICTSDDCGNMAGYIETEPLGDVKPMFENIEDESALPDFPIRRAESFTTNSSLDGGQFDIFTPPFLWGRD